MKLIVIRTDDNGISTRAALAKVCLKTWAESKQYFHTYILE